MASRDIEAITAAVRHRYGSLAEPAFHFVQPALDGLPARERLHAAFAGRAEVEEDTDPNVDVAAGFRLRRGPETLFLQLSIVAPYAALRRVAPDGGDAGFVASADDARTPLERDVADFLREAGFTLLGPAELRAPLPVELPNTSATEARVYQALFTDSDGAV